MFESRTVIKQEVLPLWAKVFAAIVTLTVVASLMFTAGVVYWQYQQMELKLNPPEAEVGDLVLPQGRMYAEYVEPAGPGDYTEEWIYTSLDEEIECLAKNLYFEGRSESLAGQLGINFAVINRVKSKHYDNSICKVVYQQDRDRRSGQMTAQFSWTLDGKSDKIGNKKLYAKLKRLSAAMLAESRLDNFVDITSGATHYHADYVNPYWANEKTLVAVLDSHVFYDLYK